MRRLLKMYHECHSVCTLVAVTAVCVLVAVTADCEPLLCAIYEDHVMTACTGVCWQHLTYEHRLFS